MYAANEPIVSVIPNLECDGSYEVLRPSRELSLIIYHQPLRINSVKRPVSQRQTHALEGSEDYL
jgi:hypothetical protein